MKHYKLSEICAFQPKKSEARNAIALDSDISFLPMEDLDAYSKYVIPSKIKKLSEVIKGYTYFKENDLLIAKITPCFENGKMGIARDLLNGVGFGSTEYIVIRCSERVLPEWVFYFLTLPFVRDEGKDLMTGAVGHKRIPRDYLEGLEIPLPKISEQKKILESLNGTLDDISQCESGLEQQIILLRELEVSTKYEALGFLNERS